MSDPEPTFKTQDEARKSKVIELKAGKQELIQDIDDLVVGTIAKNIKADKQELLKMFKKKPFGGQSILDSVALVISEKEVESKFSFSLPVDMELKKAQAAAKNMEKSFAKLKSHNQYFSASVGYSESSFTFTFLSSPPKDQEMSIEESETMNP